MSVQDSIKSSLLKHVNKTNWFGVLFGLGLSVMAAFHQFKLAPVLTEMAHNFHYSPVVSGSYMSCYAIFGLLFAGWFGNRMHHGSISVIVRRLLALTILGSLIGYSYADNMYLMLFSRSLEGIGAIGLSIAGPVVIARFIDQNQHGLAASISALWMPIGVIMAGLISTINPNQPILQLFIKDIWQLEWLIAIGLTLSLIVWGMVFQLKNISLTRLSMMDSHTSDTNSTAVPHPLWEDRNRRRAMILVAVTFLIWACQNMAFMSWLPSYLIEGLGFEQKTAAFIFIIPIAFLAIFNLVAIPLMRWMSPALLLCLTILGQGLCAFLIKLMDGSDLQTLQFCLLLFYGAFAGITPSCLFRMPSLIFDHHAGTKAFGWIMTGHNIGVLAGPMIIALALQFSESKWDSLSLVITSACSLAVVTSYILHRKIRDL